MKKIEFTVGMGLQGCKMKEVIEVDEDITEDELEVIWQNWAYERIDGGWEVIE